MTSTCASASVNGLLAQNLTGTIGGDSNYACGFLSNYTLASKCCAPEAVHTFTADPCYSWCDLPASMNDEIDNDPDFDMLGYMDACLNATGETIGPLWCRLTQAHIISAPSAVATADAPATSTFDADAFCATADPQQLISVNDPWPACGMLPNNSNHLALEACCQPAPVKWTVVHCYEYCYLPRGDAFRGLNDGRNLTDDQILGSFKTCMLDQGNGTQDAFEGMLCRANGSALDLGKTNFQTDKYLTGTAVRNAGFVNTLLISLGIMVLVMLLSR